MSVSLLAPDVVYGNTLEDTFYSTIESFQIVSTATKNPQSGVTSFMGNFGFDPQFSTTAFNSYANIGQTISVANSMAVVPLIKIRVPLNRMMVSESFTVNFKEHFSGTVFTVSDQMPDELTEAELYDIHQGIMEIKAGKAKQFNTMRETIEWLHRKHAK